MNASPRNRSTGLAYTSTRKARRARIVACLLVSSCVLALTPSLASGALGDQHLTAPKPTEAVAGLRRSARLDPAPLAYRGLGTWVDIYDPVVFDHPEAAVRSMAARGVRTIYVETGNSGARTAIHRPAQMSRLIVAAHSRKMRVVAWYLPTLTSPSRDYSRVAAAIRFRTPNGQRFDSFALDIESSAVRSVSARNTRLIALSRRIRALVGPKYPLGAIIPSPAGMSANKTYWPTFPYGALADVYDVFVPMGYYTYHGEGAAAAYADTRANVRILRAQPRCISVPIHMIGGLGGGSTVAEVRAFVNATHETGCAGASLYDWTTTRSTFWPELKRVVPDGAAGI